MRPRYLEIEGLQSFKELQRVDFDKLSETGLFGIFGPTGSGKSTILDAITLALYGSVHRAAKGTQGIINTDMGGIKVSFTFDLTKESLKKTYRVERQYKRKKDSDSSAEAKLVRLLEISEQQELILADKHSDVNNYIVQLVGLKFEDFTRSVVLPQNKFQEFLLSPRGEKTKMLERIFYLEEYGRQLGDKFNKQMAAIKNKLSNIEGALSTLGNSSPEALIESERIMMEAKEHRASCAVKLKHTEEKYTKGMGLYKLSMEHNQLQQKLEAYRVKEAEIQRLKEICIKSEAANTIKPIMTAYKEAKISYEETNLALSTLEEQFKAIEKEKVVVQQRYDDILKQKDEKLPELIKHSTILQECQILQQEMEGLTMLLTVARKEYEEIRATMEGAKKQSAEKSLQKEALSKEVTALEQKAEELRVDNDSRKLISRGLELEKELQSMLLVLKKQAEKHNEIQQNIETYQHGYKESLDILNKCIQTLENINIEKVNLESTRPMNREEIAEQLGEINMLQSSLQNMKLANDNLKSLENKMGDYKKQEDILKTELQKLDENLLGIKNLKNEKQEQLNILLQQQNQHAAVLMAKNLIEGEKCPVCGSLEHPDIARDEGNDNDSELDHKQKEMQISIDADQEYIRSLEHEIIKLKQQQLSIKELVLQGETELQDKKTAYQKQRQALPKALTLLEEAEISDYIIQNRAALETAVEVYYLWEQKQQQLKDNIKLQENNLSEARIQQSRLATLLDSANTALGQEQKQQVEQQKAYELIYAEHKQMLKDMNVDSFSQEAEKISHKDEQLHQHTIVNKQKRIELDKVTAELQSILENINEVGNILSDKRSEGIKLKEQKEEKERKIKAVVGDKDLRTELEKAKQEIDALEILYKSSQEELNKTNQTIEEIQRRRAGLQSSFEHYKDKMQTDSKRLKEALRDKGFGDELEVEKCMLEDERLKLYQEEISRYQRERSSMEDRLNNITEQLAGKLLEEEQWQQLCNDYELIKVELEKSISQLEAAKNSFYQIKESFEKWIKLQEELKAISKKKDMLEQIQKLLKGNGFIEFISEERMRYIAREASETLGELTKFRYAIELDSENGFVIRDNANGGVLRSVASLSGGETFLTSLSLALALSSQLQLKGQSPLEFFFLDEGFGTLDNTLLDTVIDSLERLSSNERVIGLISHVPEMKTRINRRLIVEAPDRAGKGSKISIEKA